MSNVERKPRKFKIVIVPVIVSLLVLVAVLIMREPVAEINEELAVDFPFESLKIEYEKGRDTAFAVKIRKEENCDLDIILNDGELILKMNTCPSLSKAIDNDAGVCPKYCLHCPGWTAPLYQKAGLYQIFDVMGIENPQCIEWIYEAPERAKAKYKELLKSRPAEELRINFEL